MYPVPLRYSLFHWPWPLQSGNTKSCEPSGIQSKRHRTYFALHYLWIIFFLTYDKLSINCFIFLKFWARDVFYSIFSIWRGLELHCRDRYSCCRIFVTSWIPISTPSLLRKRALIICISVSIILPLPAPHLLSPPVPFPPLIFFLLIHQIIFPSNALIYVTGAGAVLKRS